MHISVLMRHFTYLYAFPFFLNLAFPPVVLPRNKGIFLPCDIFSIVSACGFIQNNERPGNFLLSGHYNYSLSVMVELNGDLIFYGLRYLNMAPEKVYK
jgi:hypothetical protein